MLATLLVIRQFLQNVKEVAQPHLYQKMQQGEINPRSILLFVRFALRRLVQKYALPPRPARTPGDPLEAGMGNRKKCLNGGCGVPEEEEEGVSEEEEMEEESIMDCGLKLKRVSFLEKEERRVGESTLPQQDDEMGFLQEGSPTLVEKGSDPASVFQLAEDEEDEKDINEEMQDLEEAEAAVKLRPHRRRRKRLSVEQEMSREGEEEEEEGARKQKRESWMDPPEDHYPTKLTQAEVESCMKKYEVRHGEVAARLHGLPKCPI